MLRLLAGLLAPAAVSRAQPAGVAVRCLRPHLLHGRQTPEQCAGCLLHPLLCDVELASPAFGSFDFEEGAYAGEPASSWCAYGASAG